MERLKKLIRYCLDRLQEASTIQGLAAAVTLVGGVAYDSTKIAAWTALAAGVSAMLKIILPDSLGGDPQ